MPSYPLNILMLCPDYKPNFGGEAELAYSLAMEFNKLARNLSVLAPTCSDVVPEDAALEHSIIRELELKMFLPLRQFRGYLSWPKAMKTFFSAIRQSVQKTSPDVCFISSYMTWIILSLWRLKVPYTLFLHGEDIIWMVKRGGISKWIFFRACKSAKWIFFNSRYSRDILIKYLPEIVHKSESVGCGIRTNIRWTTENRDEAQKLLNWQGGPILLTVAKLIMRKGIDTTIKAMPDIIARYPNCRYVVVGDGPDRSRFEKIAREEGVSNHFSIMGHVNKETKELIYSSSDIYIMVSYPGEKGEKEGFGITFLEANLHGLPVIGSRCGGIIDSVEDRVNGVLVNPKNSIEVSEAVINLLENPDLCKQLVKRGRQRIEEQFNWPSIANRILKRIEDSAV